MRIPAERWLKASCARRLGGYYAKAAVAVGLLGLFAASEHALPPFAVALVWALLAGASAWGIAYHALVKKSHRRLMLKQGGKLARLNEGRAFSLVAAFAVAAVCTAGLMIEAPAWDGAAWALVVSASVLFPALFALASKFLNSEFEAPYRLSRAVLYASLALGALLCAAYAVGVALQPAVVYSSATEAFLSARQPFEGSPSVLLGEIGVLKQLVDGFTAYGVSKATEASAGFYIAWRVVLGASAFFGVANLLGFSALGVRELKCVFQPLDAVGEPGGANADDELSGVTSSGTGGAQGAIAGPDERAAGVVAGAGGERPIVKRFAAVAAVLPLCLVVAFLVAESTAASAAATQEYSAAEAFARDQVGIAVYVLDGKYYEQQAVQELVDTANARSQALFEDARATLVPLVNESYDARIANVDAYLDWYYSLPADYERLGRLITGTVEGYMQDQFESRIEAGIDDSRLSAELERVIAQAEAIQADLAGGLASHEVTGVPDWLMTAREAADLSALTLPSEPTRKLLGAAERFGVSAAAGAAAGIVAKRLVRRALAKPFFSKIVARVTSALASKGIGAGIGAAAGSAVGPLGTIAGAAAGVAAGLGVDYGLLKIDELQNREEYRSEIIAAIEEERAEMLAVVGA